MVIAELRQTSIAWLAACFPAWLQVILPSILTVMRRRQIEQQLSGGLQLISG